VAQDLIIPPGYKRAPINGTSTSRTLHKLTSVREMPIARKAFQTWEGLSKQITPDVVDYAMAFRQVPPVLIDDFSTDYTLFVNQFLAGEWTDAVALGATGMIRDIEKFTDKKWGTPPKNHPQIDIKNLVDEYYAGRWAPEFALDFPDLERRMSAWINAEAAEDIVSMTQAQISTTRKVIHRGVVEQGINGKDLAWQLKETCGLTPFQEERLAKYRAALAKEGVTADGVRQGTAKYATTMRKQRALSIGRTELAKSYNYANHETIIEAVDKSILVEKVEKKWYASSDERVCDLCGDLHGHVVGLREVWIRKDEKTGKEITSGETPPIHTMCRCIIIYETIIRA